MSYKCTTISLFLMTGCCFCCCCYFNFCFCCGLCLSREDKKTLKAIEEGKMAFQDPYKPEGGTKQSNWKEVVITEQPKETDEKPNLKKS